MSRRFKLALFVFGYFLAFGLLEFTYKYLDYLTRSQPIPFAVPLIEELTGAFAGMLLFPLIVWTSRRYPLIEPGWPWHLVAHVGAMIVFGAAATTLMWGLRTAIFPVFGLGHYDYGNMHVRYFMEFPGQVMVYSILASGVMMFDYYESSRDRQLHAAQLEKSLAKAQLQNLRLQLQPHFLFNTLNTISALMYEDVRSADRMIARLSDLLRLSLEHADAQEVTLAREIEFLNLYVETMKARFEDRLSVRIEADAEARRALVPPLVLQPLVENSIRHGVDPDSSAVAIEVWARRENGHLRLDVRDHGPGLKGTAKQALSSGVGLSNTAERLNRLYRGLHGIEIENVQGGGLCVTVKVPYHVDPGAAG